MASSRSARRCGGAWILSLPPAPDGHGRAADREGGSRRDAAALKPPKRQRPLIAIIGINDATEVTDYLMPYGILRRADVADVVVLATGAGAGEALSGAQGRAARDGRGVRCAASGRRRLRHRARHEPRRRSGGPRMAQEPGGQGRDDHRRLRRRQGRRRGRPAGRQAGDDPLVLRRGAARPGIPRSSYVADRRMVVDQGVATTTGSPRPCRCRSP